MRSVFRGVPVLVFHPFFEETFGSACHFIRTEVSSLLARWAFRSARITRVEAYLCYSLHSLARSNEEQDEQQTALYRILSSHFPSIFDAETHRSKPSQAITTSISTPYAFRCHSSFAHQDSNSKFKLEDRAHCPLSYPSSVFFSRNGHSRMLTAPMLLRAFRASAELR